MDLYGAEDQARTGHTNLGKVVLYQMSYFRFFADWTGLEPATSAVTGRHSNQLNYQSFFASSQGFEPWTLSLTARCSTAELRRRLLGRQDSNLRPLGPKPSALPGCATSQSKKNPKLKSSGFGLNEYSELTRQ